MTKQEAIAAMETGSKVTHRSFLESEYIVLHENGYDYTDEQECIVTPFDFWESRTHERWLTGWSLFTTSPTPIQLK